jgi:hypothetical protein
MRVVVPHDLAAPPAGTPRRLQEVLRIDLVSPAAPLPTGVVRRNDLRHNRHPAAFGICVSTTEEDAAALLGVRFGSVAPHSPELARVEEQPPHGQQRSIFRNTADRG